MNKALFWDFDGTLSYPNKLFQTALYDSLKIYGYDIKNAIVFLEKNLFMEKSTH